MEDGGYRTNQRLECFFKRHLGQMVSDALRISEPCIVVGESYGHAFKFIALTDRKLFILANPPQTENDFELTIELQDIQEIKNVHDIPDFLSGDLQKNVQHFIVTYVKLTNPKLHSSPSASSLSSMPSLSLTPKTRRRIANGDHRPFIRRMHGTSNDDSPLIGNEGFEHSSRSDVFEGPDDSQRASTVRFTVDDFPDPNTRNRSFSDPLSSVPNAADIKSSTRSRPLPPPAPGTEKTNASTVMNSPKLRVTGRRRKNNERKRSRGDTPEKSSLRFNSSEPHLDKHVLASSRVSNFDIGGEGEHSLPNSESGSSHSIRTSTLYDNARRSLPTTLSQTLSASFSARVGSIFGKTDDRITNSKTEKNDDDSQSIDRSEATLDIYLINGDSQLISLLRATRINFIIALTLEDCIGKEKSSNSTSSKILEEFHQLKEEIVKCNEIETAFIFTKELLTGCRKRPVLKKLFWKTDELLNYYIRILEEYLGNRHEISMRGDDADQLDFMLIIAELIIMVIFNTEILPSRNKILFGHRGSLVVKMLKISLAKPGFLKNKEYQSLSPAATLLLSGVDLLQKSSEKELEMTNLLGEWADICSSLIYELMNAAEQCTWTYRDGKGISVHCLIDIMSHHTSIEPFLDEMIKRIMHRLTEGKLVVKRPDIVLLFKQFSLLHFIFENSQTLSNYLVENYYEEFRYYIGSPQFIDGIPNCPLFSTLAALITRVSLTAVNY